MSVSVAAVSHVKSVGGNPTSYTIGSRTLANVTVSDIPKG